LVEQRRKWGKRKKCEKRDEEGKRENRGLFKKRKEREEKKKKQKKSALLSAGGGSPVRIRGWLPFVVRKDQNGKVWVHRLPCEGRGPGTSE